MKTTEEHWNIYFDEKGETCEEYTSLWTEKHICTKKHVPEDFGFFLVSKLEECEYTKHFKKGLVYELYVSDCVPNDAVQLREFSRLSKNAPYDFYFGGLCFYFSDLEQTLECLVCFKEYIEEICVLT